MNLHQIKYRFLFTLLLSGIFISGGIESTYAQDAQKLAEIFSDFEKGVLDRNVDTFFKHLDNEIYLGLVNNVSGYFSANQSYHLIKKYLDELNPTTFRLTQKKFEEPFPYSLGTLYYNRSGIRGNYQVYISLKKEERGWKISQITIN